MKLLVKGIPVDTKDIVSISEVEKYNTNRVGDFPNLFTDDHIPVSCFGFKIVNFNKADTYVSIIEESTLENLSDDIIAKRLEEINYLRDRVIEEWEKDKADVVIIKQ